MAFGPAFPPTPVPGHGRSYRSLGPVRERIPTIARLPKLQLSHITKVEKFSVAEPGTESSTRVEYARYPHVERIELTVSASKPLQEKQVERHMIIHFK
jgi:hypothetical protein